MAWTGYRRSTVGFLRLKQQIRRLRSWYGAAGGWFGSKGTQEIDLCVLLFADGIFAFTYLAAAGWWWTGLWWVVTALLGVAVVGATRARWRHDVEVARRNQVVRSELKEELFRMVDRVGDAELPW